MGTDRSGRRHTGHDMCDLEQELTMHLERAHELGERLRRSNTAVEEQLRLTRQIALTLKHVADDEG
jgi:hypothetical protein